MAQVGPRWLKSPLLIPPIVDAGQDVKESRLEEAMRILRWLGIALVALVALLVGIGVVARFSDGPMGPIPGGTLRTGSLVSEADIDWSIVLGDKGACVRGVCPPSAKSARWCG